MQGRALFAVNIFPVTHVTTDKIGRWRCGGSTSGPRRDAASPLLARRNLAQQAGKVEKGVQAFPSADPPPLAVKSGELQRDLAEALA